MRETVCNLVASGIRETGQRLRMAEVMGRHGEFAAGVLKYVLRGEEDRGVIGNKTVKVPVDKAVHVTIQSRGCYREPRIKYRYMYLHMIPSTSPLRA